MIEFSKKQFWCILILFAIAAISSCNEQNDLKGSKAGSSESDVAGSSSAGFVISAISGSTTEAGGTAIFTVKLNSQPSANVSIAISSSDTTEGTVSPSSIIFTSSNWSTDQTVTVTGVDDTAVDGNIGYTAVLGIASSIDSNYSGLDPTDVTVTNNDDDTPGITFNSNGTKMFIVGIDNTNGEEINEYSLSVAYDLTSTVTHLEAFDISGSTGVPQDVAFNANGTEVFVVSANGEIFSWTLATAYDVSNPTANHDINLGGNLRGLKFNTDGSKMFVYNATNDSVVEYTLSTAYDPSTRSSTTVSYESTVITRDQQGMAFSSDGTKMYLVRGAVGGGANWIVEYNLSIGYDLSSTITHVGTHEVDVDADTESISGLTFRPDGSQMFHTDFTKDAVQEYTLDCGFGLIQCINPTDDEDDVASVEVQAEVSKKLIQHTTFPVLNRMEWLRRNKNSNNSSLNNYPIVNLQVSNNLHTPPPITQVPNYSQLPSGGEYNQIQGMTIYVEQNGVQWRMNQDGSFSRIN